MSHPILLSRRIVLTAIASALPLASWAAWPERPLRFVVPYSAGGGADNAARIVGQRVAELLGQPVIIDNKPGAGGVIGADNVAKSAPDGYTALFDASAFGVNGALRKLPYDPLQDFIPVSLVVTAPQILVVAAQSPYKTLADLLAAARKTPGKLTFASAGGGTASHLAAELMNEQAKVELLHVPYKGGAQALTDVIGDSVTVYFGNAASTLQHVTRGKLRALAVTSPQRVKALPAVATLSESGMPQYEVVEWNGVFLSKGTPPDVVQRIAKAVQSAVADKRVRERLEQAGVIPLDMPESVLVRFKGQMQPGITLRDLVHAIPLYAIKQGLLTVAKQGKINAFSGRILEIEGLPELKVEQAFELSDASAERSAAGCTIKLNKEPVQEYLKSNIVLMKNMIADGYQDKRTLERRIKAVEAWLAKPELLEADKDAEYAAVIEIDLAEIKEPIVCCPNDPDDAKFLSEVAGAKIDEAFIGSCMTNIGHFRAAAKLLGGQRDIPVKLWVAPPTKMDQSELIKEGHYAAFGTAGARTEMPGCSLCMGNQAQVREGATVVSTSTRNFPNRLGKNTNVFLGSAELAAIASKLGKLPSVAEYHEAMGIINKDAASVYRYMNFDQIEEYAQTAKEVAV
ncbi:MAG: tripartite tricarboxylate transporter substrate-binding protein [Cupriavidus necator]